jgi:hypothetical protein
VYAQYCIGSYPASKHLHTCALYCNTTERRSALRRAQRGDYSSPEARLPKINVFQGSGLRGEDYVPHYGKLFLTKRARSHILHKGVMSKDALDKWKEVSLAYVYACD